MVLTMKNEQENLVFHPKNIMLAFLLFGLAAMFLSLTVAYVFTRNAMHVPPVKLPAIFAFNTVLLLLSSWSLIQVKRSAERDHTAQYIAYLRRTIALSVLFLVMQMLGWYWLFTHNLLLNSSTTTAYLYVISCLHLLHVVAGLPFLIIFYLTAKKRMVDPVTVLVYFSDPDKRLKLRLLTIYWHFLDGLWIYLVLFFFFNSLM